MIGVPVCYVWTEHNTTMPASVAARAQQLTPSSEFHLIRNCGHWPHIEGAADFVPVVARFLAA